MTFIPLNHYSVGFICLLVSGHSTRFGGFTQSVLVLYFVCGLFNDDNIEPGDRMISDWCEDLEGSYPDLVEVKSWNLLAELGKPTNYFRIVRVSAEIRIKHLQNIGQRSQLAQWPGVESPCGSWPHLSVI
jgi:hypothetical protein